MIQQSKPRIGGWLWLPLIWLALSLLTSTLVIVHYYRFLLDTQVRNHLFAQTASLLVPLLLSLLTATLLWLYTLWISWLFYQRSGRLPRHYIIWLLLTVILAIKSWAFSPVSDVIATRNLLISLLTAAIFAIYLRRSARVKTTFTAP
ncbi:hypothetical protein BL250_04120 [Erwinia sp. OLTSP20]|uniref:DUF2569 domain-containing protein n=1 Tax=unclassified Erwinia TaxID=2622719 RepID=UPI000C194E08|nr:MULTISPECIES: DUF2569 domain-containing protein [unclassified Erwinia]PIJ51683.1 hypothetical protein BV501_03050 [Erwinia sp. OAMSP11]PIJ75570.1 hypothetical protein BK416_01345 [Erwinia sp. OLSSP12]PIJ84875.1 hypothetical protein BLD47_01275 [Erwinia sp. OLCASP19]PIJ86654.1 hypothetical protein BLD46_02875 [Erwinia sp. OLMTSP26]PIJ88095.1 hypothetical protein BLD49_03555 [Erwinia sp. OLMDSP33]